MNEFVIRVPAGTRINFLLHNIELYIINLYNAKLSEGGYY